jgi:hypothetical protein
MKRTLYFIALIYISGLGLPHLSAQTTDSLPAAEEEDYSIYENVTFTDAAARRYCSPKILDLSPQRFVSVSWDAQLPYTLEASPLGRFAAEDSRQVAESARVQYSGGLRLAANIPVVSRNNLVWQMGANFWDIRYRMNQITRTEEAAGLANILQNDGLRTLGLNTTLFKPLGERTFLLFQGSADLSGNYTFSNFQGLEFLRYSGALLWGKRPNDRKQWGVGLSRTYRVGEMNYIPVVFFNYTAPNRKWGTEILFPARAHLRRNFSPRQLLLLGYELEGQSYRIRQLSEADRSLEIRRGELRTRIEYQRQISGFVWLSVQGGWRYNWSFQADMLNENRDFFRGFTGTQPYAMLNNLGNALYFNIGVHLVSP